MHRPCPSYARKRRLARGVLVLLTAGAMASSRSKADDFQGATHLVPFEEESTINYSKAKSTGPVAKLQERIDHGELKLRYDERYGYLPAVLDALHVSKETQLLVYSKTSFQRERIAPKTPRSLYYSDDAYIGFIPGSPLLELTSVDPKLGAVFYTLDQSQTDKPKFIRTDQCLECHASAKSMGVPGHLIRSFTVDENGVVDMNNGTSLITHRTPLAERWGGWYVTGEHGEQSHRGNLFGKAAFARAEKQTNYLGNQQDLSKFFDTAPYLEKTSDITALMVFEHEAHMHNFITRLNYEASIALQTYGHLKYLRTITDAFLRYLLFTEEVELTSPIQGSAGFARTFVARGPRDKSGRSLRDFDLQTRLFKYPCSFLIYSDAFDQLPKESRELIYQKLFDILTGKDDRADWQRLSLSNKSAIREILAQTKTNLPAYWTAGDGARTNRPL